MRASGVTRLRMLEQFDHLADEYKFQVVDATPDPRKIFDKLRAGITKVLESGSQRPALEIAPPQAAAAAQAITSMQPAPQPSGARGADAAPEGPAEVSSKTVAETAGPLGNTIDLKV